MTTQCDFCQGEFESYELEQCAEYFFCSDCAGDSEVEELQEQAAQDADAIAETYHYLNAWLDASK